MRLKRLELQGFKSFLDRTILTFEPGITGVVGPNGCGKSNIVDAIMWVMGEQSPKHLRGDTMTDIIFNGSDSKAATSMAEVSLVLDRQGVALSPQFAAFDKSEEISVTRRIYRDGGGEFLINRVPCRLRDIHELFMDTGVGRRAYSIIEQGQIDRMINVKPDERRYLFEEVAGITKYKSKRKEAEKKLELTRQNILRLQDIITELEKQIRSLKIQATKARKFRELKTELENVDLYLLGRSLDIHQKALQALEAEKIRVQELRSELDAKFSQADAAVTELDVLRVSQEREYQDLSEKERDLSTLIQRLENQLNVLDERRKYLSQSNELSHREEEAIHEKVSGLQAEKQATLEEQATLETSLLELDNGITHKEAELKEKEALKLRLIQKKESHQERMSEVIQKEVYLKNQKQHGEQKEREYTEARAELNASLTDIIVALEENKKNLASMDSRLEQSLLDGQKAEKEVADLFSECQQLSSRLTGLEDELFKARETFHSRNSRLQSLRELQQNLEGYSPTAKEILLRLEDQGNTAVPLADILQPEAELEVPLEMLLGTDINTLLVQTSEEAERLSRLIEEKSLERVRILSLSEPPSSESVTVPEGTTALLSRIRVREGYETIAKRWLGKAFLCNSKEDLFRLKALHPQCTFLSVGSQIIAHADGTLTSGTPATKAGIFSRRREIEELELLCQQLDESLKKLDADRESLLQHLKAQETLHTQLKDKLSSIHIQSMELRKEREKIQIELARTDRDYMGLMEESSLNLSQLEGIRTQLEQWSSALSTLIQEKEDLVHEAKNSDHEIQEAGEATEALQSIVNSQKIERSRLGERRHGLQYKLDKIGHESSQLQIRREAIFAQRLQGERELHSIEEETLDITGQKDSNTRTRNQIVVQLSDLKLAFNETSEKLQQTRLEKDVLQKKRESVLTETQEIELKWAAEQSHFEQVRGISMERYHREATPLGENAALEMEKVPLFAAQLTVNWNHLFQDERETLLKEHLKNVREKVERYGEVNLTAIQEFDEIQKRYDFLMEQRTDLENSIKILEQAILKIDDSTKKRFEETFEAVNQKFKEIFPILFNGGKAELALTEAANVLEAGVDIMVQPPGKRLQSITLLSGGEKALTAVSLILAIFARRPSPFCLLDEVDAPLDDANVSRFNTVVRKMAEKTQFIVITHNKKTMEIAEALYGVTMERAGISKMTSVRLN